MKKKGNEALAAGHLENAMRCYDARQEAIGLHCRRHENCGGEVRADLQVISTALSNNTALASLRLAKHVEEEEGAAAVVEFYMDAVGAATEALALDSGNAKAQYRQQVALAKVVELDVGLQGTRVGGHCGG
jgi:hypothetical protein